MSEFLLVNVPDLHQCGTLGTLGSVLNLMVSEALGDRLLPSYCTRKNLDDVYLVVESTPERCAAMKDALELIGRRKINRKIRCLVRKRKPSMKQEVEDEPA